MSLLLDALKDADGRRNKPAVPPGASAGAQKSGQETHVLSILEDSAPAETPAATSPPPPAAEAARSAAPDANARPARRVLRGAAKNKPAGMRRFVLPALLIVTIVVMGVGYKFLSGSQELPKLVPSTMPQAALTVDVAPAATTAATDMSEEDHVKLEPGLKPVLPDYVEDAAPKPHSAPVPAPVPAVVGPLPAPVAPPAPPIQMVRSVTGSERSTNDPLQKAYLALRSGDLAAAEAGYREALRIEPYQIDAHLGLAVLAQNRGNIAAALTHYRAVLDNAPDHARAWSGLSDIAGAQELDGMESKLRGLIANRPAPTLLFALGNVLARQSRWSEAQESYFRAASAEPGNAEYAFNLAVSLDHLGKRDAAVSWYSRALEFAGDGRSVQFDTASASKRLAALQESTR